MHEKETICEFDGETIMVDEEPLMLHWTDEHIAKATFELIEEQQDIDIQELEELRLISGAVSDFIIDNRNKINELIQAVKQLDRNINKE